MVDISRRIKGVIGITGVAGYPLRTVYKPYPLIKQAIPATFFCLPKLIVYAVFDCVHKHCANECALAALGVLYL
jgi:hypothetical protein